VPTQDPPASDIASVFKSHGARLTEQRERVFHLFAAAARPLSTAEATAMLAGAGIGAATLYRTVSLLTRLGLLKRVQDGRTPRYVSAAPGHRHMLVCTGCGAAVQFETCELGLLERLLSQETGYEISGHHLEMHGLCPRCACAETANPRVH
jgi:Fur family transcriptional regulator, ferric uptake regulator